MNFQEALKQVSLGKKVRKSDYMWYLSQSKHSTYIIRVYNLDGTGERELLLQNMNGDSWEVFDDEIERLEWVKIPGSDYEVTKEVIHKGKSYEECESLKPKDCEFLDLEIIGKIVKYPEIMRILKMDGSSSNDDFHFTQPFPINKSHVARFGAYSGGAGLNCDWGPSYTDAWLGVRWMRRKKW